MPHIELVADLPGHSGPAWAVSWNPCRPILASCSSDKTVRLYAYTVKDSGSSQSKSDIQFRFLQEIPTAHKRTIRSIAWSPNGKSLATGSFDSTVGIWEELDEYEGFEGVEGAHNESVDKEWECTTTLEGHESECKGVSWSSDGTLLASCSRDKSVWIWELQADGDFECISVMMEHSQDVKSIAWHPSEEILASASYDASIYLFADDPDSDWSPFQKLNPSISATPAAVSATCPSSALLTADASAADFVVPPLEDPETVWSLAFSPCGQYLASGGDGGGVRIWGRSGNDIDSRWIEKVHVEAHNARACFSLTWTAQTATSDNASRIGRLVSAGGDGRICYWDVTKGRAQDGGSVQMELLAVQEKAHSIYDINSVQLLQRKEEDGSPHASKASILDVLSETHSQLFATAGDDGGIKVWRISDA